MTTTEQREAFNRDIAPLLAAQVGAPDALSGSRSRRFGYFGDDSRFVVVAGPQEKGDADLALAFGLTYKEHRQLILLLPEGFAFPTLQRSPWLKDTAQPDIWLHNGSAVRREPLRSQYETKVELKSVLKDGQDFEDELRQAATPAHLGERSASVARLAEWATRQWQLDGSHRRGERAWHCMGQKVLSIKGSAGGLTIKAGVHYSDEDSAPVERMVPTGDSLSAEDLNGIQEEVCAGIAARLSGAPPIHRPDEHWLQAVIRRDPSLVGVEHPALRELPAWRPRSTETAPRTWGRGYLDLVGVDGHGDVRLVETKIANNTDELFVLQGLDYYVWATVYRDVLLSRLGASTKAELEIHYVIGDTTDGEIHISAFAEAQAQSLDESIRWRFQTVHDWYRGPDDNGRAHTVLLPPGDLPA